MRDKLAALPERENTSERRERLRAQREEIAAISRILKGVCLYVGGAATIMAVIACGAEMQTEAIVTGVIAAATTLYGVL